MVEKNMYTDPMAEGNRGDLEAAEVDLSTSPLVKSLV